MLQELPIADKYYYHHCISFIMLGVWIYIGIKGWKSNNQYVKNKEEIITNKFIQVE